MKSTKPLSILLVSVLAVWAGQAVYLLVQNSNTPSRIRSEAQVARAAIDVEHKLKLRELQLDHESKKHLATGSTVFDRILNTPGQTISDLINRITGESLPPGWSCEVKVEEFVHFVLLVYLPHKARNPPLEQITSSLRPIVKHCSPYLTDVAVFDDRHKSYLFFDKAMLVRLENEGSLTPEDLGLAAEQGVLFTRFNSVTVACEVHKSHFYLPIEISGPDGTAVYLALLDTGASITMLPSSVIAETGRDLLLTAPRQTFNTVNGRISCPTVKREVNIGGIRKAIQIAVNEQDELVLLGMNFFEGMNYILDSETSSVHMWNK